MSRWTDKFEKHPIHETLSWLETATSTEYDQMNEVEVTERRRLNKIVQKYREALATIDPELLPFQQVETLNNNLRAPNIADQVNRYISNGNVTNLQQVNNHLTQSINHLGSFIGLSQQLEPSNSIQELENHFDKVVANLTKSKEWFKSEIANLTIECDNQRDILSRLETEIESKKTELSSLTSEWQSQFSNSQESRSQEYTKWRNNFTDQKSSEIRELFDVYKGELEVEKQAFDVDLKRMLENGKEKHTSILELHNITAGDSVAAGYIKDASKERKAADIWRVASVICLIITACWLMYNFFSFTGTTFNENYITNKIEKGVASGNAKPVSKALETSKKENSRATVGNPITFSWQRVLLLFSISGVFLWLAAYSAQQSTKHRNTERKARWLGLKLKAFDPFINTLSNEDQQELKKSLAEKIFGQNDEVDECDVRVIDEHSAKQLIDSICKAWPKTSK